MKLTWDVSNTTCILKFRCIKIQGMPGVECSLSGGAKLLFGSCRGAAGSCVY